MSAIKKLGNSNNFFSQGFPAFLFTAQPDFGEIYDKSVFLLLNIHLEALIQNQLF